MDPKLTEEGWKAIVAKNRLKDKDLQKALFSYWALEDDDFDWRLKWLDKIATLAAALKKNKEVAGLPEVVKYLTQMAAAADAEEGDVTKAKALAAKTQATNQKKTDAEAKKGGADEDGADDEIEEEGEYEEILMAAFKKLKGAKDISFEFIVCDAKPHCGLMLARKITPKHKEQLTKVTGSKRFLHLGTCRVVDGKFNFATENASPGLAKKLQDSIKNYTGKKLPIVVGDESTEDEDEGTPEAIAPPKLPKPELASAPEVWQGTRNILDNNIKALKKAIQAQCANEEPDFVEAIEDNMEKLDTILEKLDNRLSDSLAKASAIQDAAARKAELKNSKAILSEYINYVKSEPLIAHLDANPFGVKTNLKAVLTGSLTHMAQAIG
jgi:ribosome-associated translation inhibitor RaiA